MLPALSLAVLLACAFGSSEAAAEPVAKPVGETASEAVITDQEAEQARQAMRAALESQGIGQETESGGYAVGGEFADGEGFLIGENLDRPDWLPADFPLPADFSITLIAAEKDGRKELRGMSVSLNTASVIGAVEQWATASGWEWIGATERLVVMVLPDGQVMDVAIQEGAGLELRLSRRDVSRDRQRVAVERQGPGTASIEIGSTQRQVSGQCVIKGGSYSFEYSASDGLTYVSVQIQQANSTPTGSASFMHNQGDRFTQYNISFPNYGGSEPAVEVSGARFAVSGQFSSMGSDGMAAVNGRIAVDCP